MSDLSEINVLRTDTGFLVRVDGRATLHQSPSLQRFAETCLMSDRCDLVVDLQSCSYIDSTFAGCLICIYKQYKSKPSEFKIVASQERVQALLHNLQLHKYFPLAPLAPKSHGDPVLLTQSDKDAKDFADHVLQCHRELCEIEGPQQEIFRQLVAQIECELREGKNASARPGSV